MIHILTDSTCDLGQALLRQYGIEFIPLTVILGEVTFRDQVDITLPELFAQIERTGQLSKTSAPSVAEFSAFFHREGEIIYLGLSSALSATVQNARLAAENQPGITVIDSLNLSSGIGLLALRAADLRKAGCSAVEITADIQNTIPKVNTSFVIDTLEYLYKGGRCSAMQNIFGSLLKIRPVIEVRPDGTLGVKDKIRGSRGKALNSLLEDFRTHAADADLRRVFITHTGCDADAEYLHAELGKIAPIEQIHITSAGCVIASHCGPNTIGILYLTR